jgi:anti-sigma-K factor RskA
MGHLSAEELIDLVEGASPEAGTPHLASCARCRHELDALRSIMAEAARAAVPEPSPLFWDHLSSRVRDAVARERAASTASWSLRWQSWHVAAVAGAAAIVLALIVAGRTSAPSTPADAGASVTRSQAPATLDAPGDDLSLTFVSDLAGGLEWEAVAEAGLAAGTDAVDNAVADLSSDERGELERLLTEALSGSPRGRES